jgi:hypothetical protein
MPPAHLPAEVQKARVLAAAGSIMAALAIQHAWAQKVEEADAGVAGAHLPLVWGFT